MPRSRLPRGPMREWSVYLLILVLTSLTVFGGLAADPGGRVFADNDDTSLFIWWFAHAADVVAGWFGFGSGESNLLYTTSMNHPDGVNGAWNTSVVGLALPMVPVTWLAGPVVAFNLCIIAAPVASALAAAAFMARLVGRRSAFVGGFAYGFSTYLISQASGHLNLAFAVLPPLVALGIVCLVRARNGREAGMAGLWLGAVVGWQFYVSTELLAGTFVAAVVLVACWACLAWSSFAHRLGPTVVGAGVAVVVALVIGAPLLAAMVVLPGAPGDVIRPHGVWNNDLFDLLVPGRYTLIGGMETPIPREAPLDPSEIGAYVGIVWLAVAIVVIARTLRSDRWGALVRVTAVAGLLMWLFSMGSPLRAWANEISPIGPFRLLELLPVVGNILPMRLAVHVTLALSVLLALFVRVGMRSPSGRNRRLTVIAAVASIVLVFPGAVETRPVTIPDFYTSAVHDEVPAGAVVKTLPRPIAMATPHADEAMVWQAVTGMHYREAGGYFIGSTPDHSVIYSALPDALDGVLDAYEGDELPSGDGAEGRQMIDGLRTDGVEFVAVAREGWFLSHGAEEIADFVAEAAGTAPVEHGGVLLVDIRD